MGYYTHYELTHNSKKEIISDNNEYIEALLTDQLEECKWYEHEEEMREFSKKYPKVRFTLKGEGEESGDLWEKHFLNGKMQVCKAKITFERFSRKKLQ